MNAETRVKKPIENTKKLPPSDASHSLMHVIWHGWPSMPKQNPSRKVLTGRACLNFWVRPWLKLAWMSMFKEFIGSIIVSLGLHSSTRG